MLKLKIYAEQSAWVQIIEKIEIQIQLQLHSCHILAWYTKDSIDLMKNNLCCFLINALRFIEISVAFFILSKGQWKKAKLSFIITHFITAYFTKAHKCIKRRRMLTHKTFDPIALCSAQLCNAPLIVMAKWVFKFPRKE